MELNRASAEIVERIVAKAERLRAGVHRLPTGVRIVDLGISAAGGLEAGRLLAKVCLAGLGDVRIVMGDMSLWTGPWIQVTTDAPVLACMASQYAGWQVAREGYFAMGSGPMRAAANKETLFERIGYRESSDVVVGVLETRQWPTDEVCDYLAEATGVDRSGLSLLVAPTASQAGNVQIVARSIETAVHKLFELGFDLSRIESGYGVAPLPPVAKHDLAGIGRTNDAILYGAQVTLWVRGDDASLEEIGAQVPSCASKDHGQPFREIFDRYERDFYRIDPHLFSPAVVTFVNLDTGRSHSYGQIEPEAIRRSFCD